MDGTFNIAFNTSDSQQNVLLDFDPDLFPDGTFGDESPASISIPEDSELAQLLTIGPGVEGRQQPLNARPQTPQERRGGTEIRYDVVADVHLGRHVVGRRGRDHVGQHPCCASGEKGLGRFGDSQSERGTRLVVPAVVDHN